MSNIYREPAIDASYQVSVHLAKRFQRRRVYKNIPIRNKNCLWRPCLLMDRDEMSNRNRGLSIDASYQVSTHSEEKNLKNQPIRNKNHLWRPCLLTDVNRSGRNEQSLQRTFHRCFLPSFISLGQAVSEEKLFQKSTNKKQESTMTAMFVNRSKWNEQFPQRTFHRCFLPSFGLFGQAVSEQKIYRN